MQGVLFGGGPIPSLRPGPVAMIIYSDSFQTSVIRGFQANCQICPTFKGTVSNFLKLFNRKKCTVLIKMNRFVCNYFPSN